jgi:hypothetical protein
MSNSFQNISNLLPLKPLFARKLNIIDGSSNASIKCNLFSTSRLIAFCVTAAFPVRSKYSIYNTAGITVFIKEYCANNIIFVQLEYFNYK